MIIILLDRLHLFKLHQSYRPLPRFIWEYNPASQEIWSGPAVPAGKQTSVVREQVCHQYLIIHNYVVHVEFWNFSLFSCVCGGNILTKIEPIRGHYREINIKALRYIKETTFLVLLLLPGFILTLFLTLAACVCSAAGVELAPSSGKLSLILPISAVV